MVLRHLLQPDPRTLISMLNLFLNEWTGRASACGTIGG